MVSGSGSVSSLLMALKPTFEADVPGYTLNVLNGSNTGGGVTGVLNKTLDIAAMARPAKIEETDKGLVYVLIGQTGVAFVTHAEITTKNLSIEQAQDIFFGKITNWSAVGGQDAPIIVYVRDEEESATVLLREKVFGKAPFHSTVAATLTSTVDMLTAVEGTANSIGFGFWMSVQVLEKRVGELTLNGIHPSNSDYLVLQTLGIGFTDAKKVKPLTDWLTSEKGKAALAALGVIVTA